MKFPYVLIVDDEKDVGQAIAGVLEDEGYRARHVRSVKTLWDALSRDIPDLIVLDVFLSEQETDGLELLQVLRGRFPNVPVVMISGHGTFEMAVDAVKKGAYDFIEKPFNAKRLLLVVKRALDSSSLLRENKALRHEVPCSPFFITQSPGFQQFYRHLQKVADVDSRVVLVGPSGSGKESAAQEIHRLSHRAPHPFVVVACPALTPYSFDTYFFGEEKKGHICHVGIVEQVQNGTIVLDDIGEMPGVIQGKMARFLQDQTFSRVNSPHILRADVRVLALSRLSPEEMMEQGLVREDLLYRLNIITLKVPSLRERCGDIQELVEHFIQFFCDSLAKTKPVLAPGVMTMLETYHWKGNLREMRNLIERLMIICEDGHITGDMLPDDMRGISHGEHHKDQDILAMSLKDARDVFESEYLRAQLARFRGNVSRTASFIQMERTALHRKLKTLNIEV